MLPTMAQFTAQVDKAIAEQVEWLKQEFHFGNLPLSVKILDTESNVLGMARVVTRKRTFAGFEVRFQSYNFLRHPIIAATEYSTYNAWPEIGGFETTDWILGVDVLVAHELAHIVQFALKHAGSKHPLYVPRPEYPTKMFFDGIGQYEGGHGYFFRQIYKRFRQRFINDRVARSAYTNPRQGFDEVDNIAQRIEDKTGDHPLKGLKFQFKGKTYEVAGLNPRAAKLFGYQVKTPTGSFAKIKLSLIVQYCPEAKRIVESNPALKAELASLAVAQHTKRQANAKSSQTKRRRALLRG